MEHRVAKLERQVQFLATFLMLLYTSIGFIVLSLFLFYTKLL